jgi:hypothetical protein
LKGSKFKIWLDGIQWNDRWTIGAKKAIIIKTSPVNEGKEYDVINLISYENMNLQSLRFRWATILDASRVPEI